MNFNPVIYVGIGIVFLSFMMGAGSLDTILADFTEFTDEAKTMLQLGLFTLALFFFVEAGKQ